MHLRQLDNLKNVPVRPSKEVHDAPRAWAERYYNVTHCSEFAVGGHFAALERPEELAADLRKFFRTLR